MKKLLLLAAVLAFLTSCASSAFVKGNGCPGPDRYKQYNRTGNFSFRN